MRNKNISRGHGVKGETPKQRDIKADNAQMPKELRALGKRMRAISAIKDQAEDHELSKVREVWG